MGDFMKPVIGQEAVCSDGLGRVIAFEDNFPNQWIQVSTYYNDRQCKWAFSNVRLINPCGWTAETARIEELEDRLSKLCSIFACSSTIKIPDDVEYATFETITEKCLSDDILDLPKEGP